MDRAPLATLPPIRESFRPAPRALTLGEARWSVTASVVSSLCLSAGLFAFVQRPGFEDILALSRTARPSPDAWLFPAALLSTSLVLLTPSMLLSAALLACGRRRAARVGYIALSSLVMLLCSLDVALLRSIGRHIVEIAAIALQPHGHVAGGEIGGWAAVVIQCSLASVVGTVLVTLLCQWLVALVSALLTPFTRRVLAAATAVGALMLVAAPVLLLGAWGNHFLVERLYASCLVDVRPDLGAEEAPIDPRLGGLRRQMLASYKLAFPVVTAGKPGDSRALTFSSRPPNVVLIVTESFRHDVLGPELMPRLTRWAEGGLVSTHHDAGGVYSQTGAFSLLYGRSAAAFHQTLDARVPPQLCVTLQKSGYECAFFTGHPKVWLRREEFLNAQTMDHYVHDDRGVWADWDRRALDGMVEMTRTSEKPVFAIVLLMSSHYEYQFPPEYALDQPTESQIWHETIATAMGPEAEIPLRNRYRNTMRFLDDVISDAIGRVDPQKNLVVLTGDHGESIYDDGHYTHGYSFAEVITRTPLVMVGPGVQPTRIDWPTLHMDVLPTVLHVLTGQRQQINGVQGIDWLANERHGSLLEARSPYNKHTIETQLRAAGFHLRFDLDLTHPGVKLLGFEDELGHLQPIPELSELAVAEITGAFDDQLSMLRR